MPSHLSGWLSSERPQTSSSVEDVGNGNHCAPPAGMQTGEATVQSSMAVSQKVKTEPPYDPEIPLLGIHQKKDKHQFKKLPSSIIYSCQDMEESVHEQVDEDVVQIHTEILFSH